MLLYLASRLFVLVSFSFFLLVSSRGPSSNRTSVYMRPGSHTQVPNNCLCPLDFMFHFLGFLGSTVFSEYFNTISVSSFVWKVPYTFSFRMVFFYLLTTVWIFTSAYVRLQSIKSIKIARYETTISIPPQLSYGYNYTSYTFNMPSTTLGSERHRYAIA